MEGTEGKKGTIVLNPGRKGIVYENSSEFGTSIFERAYQKAQTLVGQIIEDNKQMERSDYSGTSFQSDKQVDNIITFIGRRGTGKTSAMLSFMDSLKRQKTKRSGDADQTGIKAEFICLEWIDASLLEKNENIFETVLAKMFGEFRKNNENGNLDYDNRMLYQKFEQIYKRMSNLKRSGAVADDREAMDILNALSRSSEIREDFTELIRAYIQFMRKVYAREEWYQRDTYLVIAIDDLDLNERAYEVLEQIHRYLMVPGMIILIAINYEELLLRYEEQYANTYKNMPENVIHDLGTRAMQKGEEYLEKILPPYMRIYLPSLKKVDYALKEKRKVEIDGKEYNIKAWTFALIWKKTGVFFDACGLKRHFLEPKTLRNLGNQFQKYGLMKDLEECEGREWLEQYDKNYNQMVDDILFRIASDNLSEAERKLFIKWSEEKVIRRGKLIIDEVIELLREKNKEDYEYRRNAVVVKFREDYERYGYGYGELIRAIYCMSRKRIFDEKLVQILLVHYTVVFSRVFECYRNEQWKAIDKKKQEDSEKKLNELIGYSVGGSLGQYVLQNVRNTDSSLADDWGAKVYGQDNHVILYTLCKDEFCSALESSLSKNDGKTKWEKYWQFLNGDQVNGITILMFFISVFTGEDRPYKFEIVKPSRGPFGKYNILLPEGKHTFNIFNFVHNAFVYEDTIKNFYVALTEALCRIQFLNSSFQEDLSEKVEQAMQADIQKLNDGEIENKTLLQKFYEWHTKGGGLAIPVYNFDITYNLFLQLLEELEEMPVKIISVKKSYQEFRRLLNSIEEKLERQDKFYQEPVKIADSTFRQNFADCPVVQCIRDTTATIYEEAWNNFLNIDPSPKEDVIEAKKDVVEAKKEPD